MLGVLLTAFFIYYFRRNCTAIIIYLSLSLVFSLFWFLRAKFSLDKVFIPSAMKMKGDIKTKFSWDGQRSYISWLTPTLGIIFGVVIFSMASRFTTADIILGVIASIGNGALFGLAFYYLLIEIKYKTQIKFYKYG